MPTGSHILKMCTKCGETKPLKEFYKRWKNLKNRHEQCRSCKLKKRHEWMARRGSDYTTEWKNKNAKNFEVYHLAQDKYHAKKAGLSWEEYVRISEEQKGLCGICNQRNIPKLKRRLVFDHDHATGKFRGLICHYCNIVLGAAKDNPETLIAAAKYLEYASYAERFNPAGLGC
jgi:hypothetical protein